MVMIGKLAVTQTDLHVINNLISRTYIIMFCRIFYYTLLCFVELTTAVRIKVNLCL